MQIPVVLCITELESGGAEKAIVELALRLDRNRFDPMVCSLRSRRWHSNHSLIPRLEEMGVRVEFLDISNVFGLSSGIKKLTLLLREHKTKVLQSFLFHANMVGRMAAHRASVPVVCAGVRVAERQAKWHLWLDRWTKNKVDAWVCVSDSVANFTQSNGIPADKIKVISNGIDINDTLNANSNNKKYLPGWGLNNIVFAGRLNQQKGLDWLLATTEHWLAQHHDWHLWIIGTGEELPLLKKVADSFPFGNRIHFPGWQSEIPCIFRAADIVVLPSRWEGMPNVLLEAMAVGKPILSTNVEGVCQLLGAETPQQICDYADDKALVTKLTTMMADGFLRSMLGEINRKRVIAEFSITAKVTEYECFWQQLLDNPPT